MSRPPEAPIFYLDECIDSDILFDALVKAGVRVERRRTHFRAGAPDVEWLPIVGERGWLVLTRDIRIRKNDLELAALMNAGVGAFLLTMKDVRGEEQAAIVVGALPKIGKIARHMARPFIANITKAGDVNLIKDSGRKAAVQQKKSSRRE